MAMSEYCGAIGRLNTARARCPSAATTTMGVWPDSASDAFIGDLTAILRAHHLTLLKKVQLTYRSRIVLPQPLGFRGATPMFADPRQFARACAGIDAVFHQ
jgi:hypothetical protein